jgi:hypothetical protein
VNERSDHAVGLDDSRACSPRPVGPNRHNGTTGDHRRPARRRAAPRAIGAHITDELHACLANTGTPTTPPEHTTTPPLEAPTER